jgi:hypothetical protein
LCGEPEPEQQQQEKLSGTNFPIGELELNEKVTTRTPPHRPSKLVGRARPRGWKLRGAHEDQMHPWREMRNHITWSPGRTFESLCVSAWLFARSAKQNWPLPLLAVRALPAWLLLCALLPSLPVRRPPELTSPGFQLFPRTHTHRPRRQMQKHTRAACTHTHTHHPTATSPCPIDVFP